MPLLIQPPRFSAAARDPGLVYTIIEPDPSEQIILQDLQTWGWRVTQHDFGDEEFIDALKLIEKDIKRRRRQTHAIAGELYGYNERPTLEDTWAKEAERMLGEDAYEAERRKVEMTWLQATDRTRQMNNYLDYSNIWGEYPRLVTRGLYHDYEDSEKNPAYLHYMEDVHSVQCHLHDLEIERPRSVPVSLHHKPSSICDVLKCWKGNRRTRNTRSTTALPDLYTLPPIPIHLLGLDFTHATPENPNPQPPPYFEEDTDLIFPGTLSSKSAYIRQTRPGIKSPVSSGLAEETTPLLHAPLGEDPYGWQKWDRQMQQADDTKAQLRFFVARKRRSMNSAARRRGERGVEEMWQESESARREDGERDLVDDLEREDEL